MLQSTSPEARAAASPWRRLDLSHVLALIAVAALLRGRQLRRDIWESHCWLRRLSLSDLLPFGIWDCPLGVRFS